MNLRQNIASYIELQCYMELPIYIHFLVDRVMLIVVIENCDCCDHDDTRCDYCLFSFGFLV